MKQQSEHLSNAQIEQYGKRASDAGPETEAWVEQHLDDCSSCRSRVLDFQRTRFALLPNPKVNKASTSDCPSEDDLRNLAAGLYTDPKAAQLKAHAATCDRCGPLLQQYIEDFSDESSPEEKAFLNQLRTSSPELREQKAREMFEQEISKKNRVIPEPVPATDWRRFFSWKWIMVPATASVAIIAIGLLYLQRETPEKVGTLLAKAQTEQRTIEMRWPGAEWSAYSAELGPNTVLPAHSLMRAEDALKSHSGAESNDRAWTRAMAEKEIAAKNPAGAIAILEKLAQSSPAAAHIELDLAMAYFLDGEQTHDREYYEKSGEKLDALLAQQPKNTVAMFNRAIVYQRLNTWKKAEEEWTRFIATEPDPAWRNEGIRQLQRIHETDRTKDR